MIQNGIVYICNCVIFFYLCNCTNVYHKYIKSIESLPGQPEKYLPVFIKLCIPIYFLALKHMCQCVSVLFA